LKENEGKGKTPKTLDFASWFGSMWILSQITKMILREFKYKNSLLQKQTTLIKILVEQ
jgi:hypothetical protein